MIRSRSETPPFTTCSKLELWCLVVDMPLEVDDTSFYVELVLEARVE